MAPTSTFSKECKELFDSINLYSILGVDSENGKKLSEKEIKRAYYKCSLKFHPDRIDRDESAKDTVETATRRFQLLGKVYSILSDSEKRKVYDETGEIYDEDAISEDDGRDWQKYWRSLFKKVTVKEIEEFVKKYKDSQEELDDLKVQYVKYEGDTERIFASAFCAETDEDRDRVRARIQQLIDEDELPQFAKFGKKETEAQKKRRQRKAQKEAVEAEQMMKEIMGKSNVSDEELHNAITRRGVERESSLLQRLEEKYCNGGASSGGSSKKGSTSKKRKVQ